ncbi:putative Leu/Ile/Val-binding lipoprotein transmembrane [Parafrankia sp. EAN1pec]|uniref:ABC transporter substrate-binding protein n=1 Tax=Parafrankia sp. (strain EAN1pec) TaxID=298653 RepID=UPI0000541D5A|nr:putative Leu/Ile/Val-binding lipoprotein transmembrane [Frankia sp. EAN1pec]
MRLGGLTRRLSVAAVAALAVAVAGCSSTGGGGDSPAACNSPGVTPDQVKIGFVYSDSGTGSSSLSSARAGLDARIGLANQEGGVHGRRIAYEWRDDGSSATEDARATTELVRDRSVFGLVTATAFLSGSVESLAAQKVPVSGLIQPAWANYPNLFSFMYEVAPEAAGQYLQLNGAKKVAFLVTGSGAFTLETVERYKAAFGRIGLATADTISFARSTDSPAQVAQRLSSMGADALVGFSTPEDFADVLGAARAANVRIVSSLSLTGYDRNVLHQLGPSLAGVSFGVNFKPFEVGDAPIQRYRDAMTRFAPETVVPEQQFAMYAYLYTDLFLRGLEIAGDCPTREAFISGLRKVTNYDAGGLIEPVNLGTNATQPLQCNAFVRINQTGDAFEVANRRLCADGSSS